VTRMAGLRELLFNRATRKMEILTTPVNRLGLELRRSWIKPRIDRLMAQLRRRGIRLRPRFYLGDDWGCVAQTTNIEVAWYDADPLLHELDTEVRGWAHEPRIVDYLLRHEVGHAFCYAHKLYRIPRFRAVFDVEGSFFDTYPATDNYRPRPWSRDFVNPNRDHYAQKHPDEDFAETFGVWLDPASRWRRTYAKKKGALQKLRFVSDLVAHFGDQPPAVPLDPAVTDSPIEGITRTVAEVLDAPLSRYRRKATGYVDPLLKKIGHVAPKAPASGRAPLADVIAAHEALIEEMLTHYAQLTEPQAAALLEKLRTRAEALRLTVRLADDERKLMQVLSLAQTLAMRYVHTGALLPQTTRAAASGARGRGGVRR